jgi:integrase
MSKPRKAHPEQALSALRVKNLTAPGRYADGNGLYLVVDPSGAKRWLLRTVIQGRRRDIGLGSVKLVPLADARETARQYRREAREGGDPFARHRRQRIVTPSFKEAAERVHKEHSASWKNPKHRAQWINTLRDYAFPVFGDLSVDQVGTAEVLRALSPIWLAKPETARRVRQRIGAVMDWGKAAGFRTGDNPIEAIERALPKQGERQRHHAAMAYSDVPGFVAKLANAGLSDDVKAAFEFLILTACRTSEVLGARWSEIDLDSAIWTIPADRMKAGREHRVPLAPEAIMAIKDAASRRQGDFIFSGRSGVKPLSNMVFLMALRRMNVDVTAHGFRSAFRDWAAERTNVPREVCEMALAHMVKDKVEAAYRRGDLLQKRVELMDAWAAFVCQSDAKIVQLRA